MKPSRIELDQLFSLYIRQRDCPDGYGFCISCGAPITPKNCDCGHFIGRSNMITRWNERNCHAQCKHCNQHLMGNILAYRRSLIQKYGIEAVEELEKMKRYAIKLSNSDIRELIDYYKMKIHEVQ